MADFPEHPTDLLQDAIDSRLDAQARASLDAHLASCEQCRLELDALRWTKAQVGHAAQSTDVPGNLYARVRAALDEEDLATRRQSLRPRRASRARAWLVPAAAAAAALVAMLWLTSRDDAGAPAAAAAHLRAFQAGSLSLELESSDPPTLEAHLASTKAPAARVYDFGMMGYALVGVRTDALDERPTALTAYRGDEGQALLCEMYAGRVEALPRPSDRRTHNDIDFYVFREAEVTVVFWQEGTIVCVLSGTGDPEAIIALAFAKAIKV